MQDIRNIGAIEGQKLLTPNQWEDVKKNGDPTIQRWIDDQLKGKSCVVVLIGSATAGRRWVNYEMEKGWYDGKGVVGIHIHNMKDSSGDQAIKGADPLAGVMISTRTGKKKLSSVAKTYDPPRTTSKGVYGYIADNVEDWIEEAIKIRNNN